MIIFILHSHVTPVPFTHPLPHAVSIAGGVADLRTLIIRLSRCVRWRRQTHLICVEPGPGRPECHFPKASVGSMRIEKRLVTEDVNGYNPASAP